MRKFLLCFWNVSLIESNRMGHTFFRSVICYFYLQFGGLKSRQSKSSLGCNNRYWNRESWWSREKQSLTNHYQNSFYLRARIVTWVLGKETQLCLTLLFCLLGLKKLFKRCVWGLAHHLLFRCFLLVMIIGGLTFPYVSNISLTDKQEKKMV